MKELQRALGYTFSDETILRRALTLKGANERFNNESLECLGDSLIGFVVACKFYDEGLDEGGITERKKSAVNDRALAEVSVKLGLDKALIKPKGEFKNKKAVPSAYEAVAASSIFPHIKGKNLRKRAQARRNDGERRTGPALPARSRKSPPCAAVMLRLSRKKYFAPCSGLACRGKWLYLPRKIPKELFL